MVKNDNDWASMSDNEIIRVIGSYIKQQRLEQNITQAQLALNAGINRWTVGKIENGEPVTLASLIQILRVLDLLHILRIFTSEEKISPIEYAKSQERRRKRARSKNNVTNGNKGEVEW